MLSYALRRLAMIVPVLLGISIIVFLIMAMIPGDPALAILGSFATPENTAQLRQDLGLARSLIAQYAVWLCNLLQGDFGRSYSLNRPVLDEVLERLGPTLLLAGASLILCTILGLAAGVGLYGIALAATIFLVATLWIIEGFETRVRTFLLTVKLGERTSARRADVERLLKRAGTVFELRTTGDAELSFLVNAGSSLKTEQLTAALTRLASDGKAQIEWKDEKNVHPLPEKDDSE